LTVDTIYVRRKRSGPHMRVRSGGLDPPPNPKYPTQTLARLGASAQFWKKRVFKAFLSDFQTYLRHFSERCPTQIFGAAHLWSGQGGGGEPAKIKSGIWKTFFPFENPDFLGQKEKIEKMLKNIQKTKFRKIPVFRKIPPSPTTPQSFPNRLMGVEPSSNHLSPMGGRHTYCARSDLQGGDKSGKF